MAELDLSIAKREGVAFCASISENNSGRNLWFNDGICEKNINGSAFDYRHNLDRGMFMTNTASYRGRFF
jgi:hypothetical protein